VNTLRCPLTVALLVSATWATVLSSVVLADSFDKPLRKRVVNLGSAPGYPSNHIKLSCYYYPNFMVKELDMAEEGAEWHAIAPVQAGHLPACTRSHGSGEQVIKGQEWSGYFKGVKGGLVFLNAEDGFNGGLDFAVCDSRTGKKIFEDSAGNSAGDYGHLDFVGTSKGQTSLRYSRVVSGDCSVPKDGAACWEKFRKPPGLEGATMPPCSDYPGEQSGVSPSVLSYPVEVALFPQPSIKVVSGPVKCYPAD
jgi:hypothetical protein